MKILVVLRRRWPTQFKTRANRVVRLFIQSSIYYSTSFW